VLWIRIRIILGTWIRMICINKKIESGFASKLCIRNTVTKYVSFLTKFIEKSVKLPIMPDLDLHQIKIRIRIRIKVISRIRIRIRIRNKSDQMDSDPHPDPQQK
jgi:hypothetical protein